MEEFYLLTFKNTHDAIGGEKTLKENDLTPIVMPTPTTMTKSCGLSIKISTLVIEEVKLLRDEGKIHIKDMYLYTNRAFTIIT